MPEQLIFGPWAGGVTADSATVKAFIAKGATARLELNLAGGAANPIAPALRVAAGPDWEVAGFALTGLQPNVEYSYTLRLDNKPETGRSGRFRTFPPADAPATFRFLCGADAGGGIFSHNSNHEVFDLLREQEIFDASGNRRALFFLHLGDMHYGNINSQDVAAHLEGYRKVLKQSRQAAFFSQTPIAYVWDDHDYCGDGSNQLSAGRQAAQLAYRAGIPHYPMIAGADAAPIHQAFSVGRVRFLMTDTRSARTPRKGPDDAAKSILGAQQKEWLKNELRDGKDRYALIVWVNSVPWLGGPSDVSGNKDGWANYRTERAELGAFVQDEGVRNLLMLGADAHMAAIDDGSHNRGDTGAGGFPVFHATPLDRFNSRKGGDNYSHGVFDDHRGQYGLVEVSDDGAQPAAQVKLIGKHMGSELVTYSFTTKSS